MLAIKDFSPGYFQEQLPLSKMQYFSRSKFALALESLEYFFAKYGENRETPRTKAMIEGERLHFMVLEHEKYLRSRVVNKFKDTKSPDYQKWIKRIETEQPEATVITLEEDLRFQRIFDRVMSHRVAGKLIATAIKERHGYARCPRTGVILYSRPDIITPQDIVAELKFTNTVDQQSFNRHQFKEKWFMQLAFYNAVHGFIKGKEFVENCFYIAVEFDYPHRVEVFPLEQDFEKMGNADWNHALDILLECISLDPDLKNYEVWRRKSYVPKTLKPEVWMATSEQRYKDVLGIF